jgi:hypothetical protein
VKEDILAILDGLEENVQSMREEGETDLRTVLYYIENAKRLVNALEGK